MTEEAKNKTLFRVFSLVWLVAMSIFFISVGLKLCISSGYTVVYEKNQYESVREMILGMSLECAVDVASFLLITIAYKAYTSVAISSVILALRGLSLGIGASFCAENAVSSNTVVLLISFAMVSALMIIYTVFSNGTKLTVAARCAIYLIVTGAAAIIRLLPTMLL